jgi:hypothetical protein
MGPNLALGIRRCTVTPIALTFQKPMSLHCLALGAVFGRLPLTGID